MADNGGADAGTAGPAPELSAADNATDSPSGDASPPAAADTAAAATAGDDTSAGGDAAPPGDGNGGGGGGGGSDDNAPADTASAPEAVSVPPPAPPAAAANDAAPTADDAAPTSDDAAPAADDAAPTADHAPAVATSAEQAAPSPVSPVAGAGSPTARERTSSVGSGGSGATPRRNRKAMTRASSMRAGKGKVGAAAARRKSLLYAGNVPPSAAARPRHTSSLRNLAEGDDAAEPAEPAEASAAAPAAPATAGAPPGGEATPPASSSGAAAAGAAANTPKKPPGRMTGVMSKMGHLFKTWKKRYFVLEGSTLRYFTDESMDKQKGQIELEVGTTVTPGSKGARHFCVLIMGPGTCTCHIVAAESTRTHRSLCLWWAWHRWENGLAAGRR